MLNQIRPALVLLVLFTAVTGLLYPLAVTGVAQLAMPAQANGSVIQRNGAVVGSALIAQSFAEPGNFHPRPSAAGDGYDSASSGGSNLGPTAKALVERVQGDVEKVRDGGLRPVPVDIVTTSGSGLDPHISPASAEMQIARVAKARNLPEDRIRQLVRDRTEGRLLGIVGEPRVNVLELNLALAALPPR